MAKPEALLAQEVANYLIDEYNDIPFWFDVGADIPLPPQLARISKQLHGKWNRGRCDLFIMSARGGFGGLFVELKATETVPNTEHTRRQAQFHAVLRHQGYVADFACGLKECKKTIKKYLKLKKN